ncbi:MAG: Ig-like domain repeat protein [Bifidobacteriaceae bacterium]|jgi:alpha-tubulin suppressor-like RCC1 family protein|nr:Ig-like domain repeat protein [Bifidobacteriaceae bacterium]
MSILTTNTIARRVLACLAAAGVALGGAIVAGPHRAAQAAAGEVVFARVVAGNYHTLALTKGARVFAFGYNAFGQLGLGHTSNQSSAGFVYSWPGLGTDKVKQLAAGYYHSLALTEGGKVYGFGENASGQLGLGSVEQESTPTRVTSWPNLGSDKIVQIEAGGRHTLALTSGGKVYVFGSNGYGQLGQGSTEDITSPALLQLPNLGNDRVTQIAAGGAHSLFLTSAGKVYAFGDNQYGQLGIGSTVRPASPTLVPALSNLSSDKVVQISAGVNHTLALTGAGKIYAFGYGGSGRLGTGSTANQSAPALVAPLPEVGQDKPSQVAAGAYSSWVLTSGAKVYAFGNNANGMLGIGSTVEQHTPVRVTAWPDLGSAKIDWLSGSQHFMAVSSTGRLYGAGLNTSGQLGLGSSEAKFSATLLSVPRLVSGVSGLLAPGEVEAGGAVSVSVGTSGVGAVTPTGAVVVKVGPVSARADLSSGGVAAVAVADVPAGTHEVSVSYGGDDVFQAASASVGKATVKPKPEAPAPDPPAAVPDPPAPPTGPAPPVWRSVAGSKALVSAGGSGRVSVSMKVSGRRTTAAGKVVATVTVLGAGAKSKVKPGNVAYWLESAAGGQGAAKVKAAKSVKTSTGKGSKARAGVKRKVTLSGLTPGTYVLRLGYVGDGVLGDGASKAVRIKVSKAKPAVSVIVPSSVAPSAKAKVTVKVSAKSLKPTGKVVLSWGKGKSKTVVLKAKAKGRAVFVLPKLSKGSYTLKASYSGSAKIAKKALVKKTLKVGIETPVVRAPYNPGPANTPDPQPSKAGSLL